MHTDANGRVLAIAPSEQLPPATTAMPGCMLVPGLADAYRGLHPPQPASTAYSARTAVQQDIQFVAGATANAIYARARAVMLQALRHGTTTLGVVYAAPLGASERTGTSAQPIADLLIAAAQDTGIRLALLYALPQPGMAAADLDAAIAGFEALVRHVISYDDAHLSWAFLLPEPAAVAAEVFLALRLRTGHLPVLIAGDDNGFASMPQGRPAFASVLLQMAQLGCLDAGVSLISDAPPSPFALSLYQSHGSTYLAHGAAAALCDWQSLQAAQVACGRSNNAPLIAAPHSSCNAPLAALYASHLGALAALGLRAGTLRPGTWADMVALPWPGDEAQAQTVLRKFLAGSNEAACQPTAVFVAGGQLLQHGVQIRRGATSL